MPSPGLNRTRVLTRRVAYNGGWDGILPKRNVWVDFSYRSQLCRGLALYIGRSRALFVFVPDRGLVAFLCMW